MATAPILVFIDWKNEFDVHVDSLSVALGMILTHPGEILIDHPISFTNTKLSTAEKNDTMMERECLTMVYVLQKFRHYLLGGNFKMYTNHFALKYLVNNPLLGGEIFPWLLLFQDFDFEVIVKHGRLNLGLDHISRIESGEEPSNLEDNIPNAQLFAINMFDDQ